MYKEIVIKSLVRKLGLTKKSETVFKDKDSNLLMVVDNVEKSVIEIFDECGIKCSSLKYGEHHFKNANMALLSTVNNTRGCGNYVL